LNYVPFRLKELVKSKITGKKITSFDQNSKSMTLISMQKQSTFESKKKNGNEKINN
jgi:hypothetical protein